MALTFCTTKLTQRCASRIVIPIDPFQHLGAPCAMEPSIVPKSSALNTKPDLFLDMFPNMTSISSSLTPSLFPNFKARTSHPVRESADGATVARAMMLALSEVLDDFWRSHLRLDTRIHASMHMSRETGR